MSTKVITGTHTRWSYCNVWEPRIDRSGRSRYSISLIIPKDDTKTVEAVKAAIAEAYKDGDGVLKGTGKTVPPMAAIWNPLRDGDALRAGDPAYANSWFVNAKAAASPGIVDSERHPILERSEIYSGVYGRASITFYAFNSDGNRGIACGLNNLQKISDGEPLSGRPTAEEDFADDDFLN